MTREHGLIRCLAKGSKREKSAFSGGLEIATMGQMIAIVKPSSDLALLTAWDLIEPMYHIRRSLERYQACMFVIDLIPRLINDHDPHPPIYDALLQTLEALACPDRCQSKALILAQLSWYQWQLLEHIGSRPELMVDVTSGEKLDEDAQVYGFNPSLGGLTLDPGQPEERMPDGGGISDAWRVRRSTVDALRRLRVGEDAQGLEDVSEEQIQRVGGLLASYIRGLIGTEVPSIAGVFPQIE